MTSPLSSFSHNHQNNAAPPTSFHEQGEVAGREVKSLSSLSRKDLAIITVLATGVILSLSCIHLHSSLGDALLKTSIVLLSSGVGYLSLKKEKSIEENPETLTPSQHAFFQVYEKALTELVNKALCNKEISQEEKEFFCFLQSDIDKTQDPQLKQAITNCMQENMLLLTAMATAIQEKQDSTLNDKIVTNHILTKIESGEDFSTELKFLSQEAFFNLYNHYKPYEGQPKIKAILETFHKVHPEREHLARVEKFKSLSPEKFASKYFTFLANAHMHMGTKSETGAASYAAFASIPLKAYLEVLESDPEKRAFCNEKCPTSIKEKEIVAKIQSTAPIDPQENAMQGALIPLSPPPQD